MYGPEGGIEEESVYHQDKARSRRDYSPATGGIQHTDYSPAALFGI